MPSRGRSLLPHFPSLFEEGDGEVTYRLESSESFRNEMRSLGFGWLNDLETELLASQNVSLADVRELVDLGYDDLTVEEFVSMGIHGAMAEFIRDMRNVGFDHLRVDDLLSFRIHGVNPDFIVDVQDRARRHPTVEDLIRMRIHGF